MVRLALRNLWEHKLRTALLGMAIVAGVGFVTAAYVFTDSLSAAFDEAFAAGARGIDIQVLPASDDDPDGGAGTGTEFARMPAELVDRVRAVEGVATAEPTLQGLVTIVVEGEEPASFGPPDFGINWTGTGPFEIVDGSAPSGPDEVMIDAASAEARGVGVGETIEVAGSGRVEEFAVVGTFGFEGGGGFGGPSFVAFTFERVSGLLGIEGQVNGIEVTLTPEASVPSVVESLDRALPAGVRAVDAREAAEEQAAQLQERVSFFNTFLLVFGAISLVVGAFVVYNAFRVVVAQRGRELALLRILGTTRRQLVGSVLSEALTVGTLASLVGVGFGTVLAVGVRMLLAVTGGDLPDSGLVVEPRTIFAGVAVGVTTTLVSAIVPALRTTRISPMEALRDQPELRKVKRSWSWVGGTILAASLTLVVVGVGEAGREAALTGDTGPLLIIGGGCLAAFVGLFLVARTMSRPVIGLIGKGARSVAAELGRENARRAPRRTAVAASALMIGIGLVATVAVLSRSVEDTILDALEDAFASDLVVTPAGFDPTAGISPEVAGIVSRVEGVDEVARMNSVTAQLPGGGSTLAVGVEPETVEVALGFEEVRGSWANLGPGAVAVQLIEAENRGYSLGDVIDLTIDGEPYPAEVVAIFDFTGDVSDTQSYYLHYDEVANYQSRDFSVSVAFDEGADFGATVADVEAALSDFPSVQVTTVSDLVEQIQSALTAVVGMVAGLLLMSVIVAMVGIVLTLYLAIYERTRETGMLRAVGMTRRQVRSMIRFESILIALFGTLLGLVLGLFCGWALAVGVVGEGVSLSVPWLWVVSGLLGALVAGVAAAVIPARRAARMDILAAIAYE